MMAEQVSKNSIEQQVVPGKPDTSRLRRLYTVSKPARVVCDVLTRVVCDVDPL